MAVDATRVDPLVTGGAAPGRSRHWVALGACFVLPVAVLAGSYAWLMAEHGTAALWNVVVHESGVYTLGETVFYFSHFLRELPTLLGYTLFLLGASGALIGDTGTARRQPLTGWLLLIAAVALVGGALLASALADGPETALSDLFQFRTRDDQSGYGTHWRFHWLSTLWFGAAAGLIPAVASRLFRGRAFTANRRWMVVAWSYFALLTIVFGLSENVFLDLRYVGHQAREIMTHGPVTLLMGLGILKALDRGRGARADDPAAGSAAAPWIFGVLATGIPLYLVLVSLSGDVLAEGQPELGLSAMVAAHFFEHTLDYVLVSMLLSGAVLLARSPEAGGSAIVRRSVGDAPVAARGRVGGEGLTLAARHGETVISGPGDPRWAASEWAQTAVMGEEESAPEPLEHAVTVVIPAYNEARHVARQIREVAEVMARSGWQYEIIVVDDGSTDGTGAQALQEGVRVLRNRRNRGYGASLKRGIAAAGHDWVLITDADGTYPSSAIPGLLALADENEMVVGARITQNREIPLARRPAKWFLTRLASYLARRPLPDLNSGMRLIRRDLVDRYLYLLPSGFSFTTTITLAAASNEHEVAYVPIDYHARIGQSKIRPGHAVDFLLLVVRIVVFFNPLRVFVPIGALLAVLGLAKLAYDLSLRNISESALLGLLGALVVWAVGLLADQNATIARKR